MIQVPGIECLAVALPQEIEPRRVARPRQDRRCVTYYDTLTPNVRFCVHANSKVNLVRGMVNRVLTYKGAEPILPSKKGMDAMYRLIDGFTCSTIHPLSDEAFLRCYSGRRQAKFEAALASLVHKPLRPSDAYVSTFIKAEKFDYFAKGVESDPRMIQPRSYRFLAAIGKHIKPMEHKIYNHLTESLGYAYPCVAKGFNAAQSGAILRQKWDLFESPVAISLDASRFDLHVSKEMLEWTHAYYRKFNRTSEFRKMLEMTLENTGFAVCADYEFKYKVSGRRMSGDMDTALGNCIIMVCMTHLLMTGIKHEIFCNGDDCLIICESINQPETSRVLAHYEEMGFHIKLEDAVTVFEQIEFCQTRPVDRGDTWVMVRNISAIAKDFTMIGNQKYTDWLRAVGVCGSRLADGIPVYTALYKWMYSNGTKSRIERSTMWECGMVNLSKGMTWEERPILEQTRLSFERAFGIDTAMQLAIEEYYSTMGPLGNYKSQWQTRRDLQDPNARRIRPFAHRRPWDCPSDSPSRSIRSGEFALRILRTYLPQNGSTNSLEPSSTDTSVHIP